MTPSQASMYTLSSALRELNEVKRERDEYKKLSEELRLMLDVWIEEYG